MSGRCLAVIVAALLQCLAVFPQEHKYPVEDAVSKRIREDLRASLCEQLACQFQNGSAESEPASTRIRATLQLLREGDQKIQLSKKYTHAVLTLGNSGAGKSTFTQWISGNTELEAIETAGKDGTYLIVDRHGRISNSTIDSKTIFPELVVDYSTNTYFYDYPGFSDTRGSHNDISTSYFINKVLEHVEAVKLLFLVGYPSVRQGVDRQDFVKLLKHATELVKDIDKYKESIALVVTKVDNQYRRKGKNLILVEDDQVIGSIGSFLHEAKLSLENRVQNSENTLKDSKFNENSLKLINILLSKNENGYTKIRIFRRPEEPGSISDNSILNEEKGQINQVLQQLCFTKKKIEDFGYTLSEKSLVEIYDLVEEINKNISSGVGCINQKLRTYYRKLSELAHSKIASFDLNSSTDKEFEAIKICLSEITKGHNTIENVALKVITVLTVQDFTKSLSESISNLDALNGIQNIMAEMSVQSRYFDFLQTFIGDNNYKKTITASWASSFRELSNEFFSIKTVLESSIQNLETNIDIKVKNDIQNIQDSVLKHFVEQEKDVHDIISVHKYFEREYEKISTLYNYISENTNSVSEIYKYLKSFNVIVNEPTLSMLKQSKYMNILNQAIKINLEYVLDTWKYYKFLNNLYTKLSEYDIQKNTTELLKISKAITESEQNKRILDTTLEQFLNKCCQEKFNSEYNDIKNVTLNQYKLRTLAKLFSITLKHDVDTYCNNDDNELVVKGYFVKLSDALLKRCQKPVKILKIFALHTVFIDMDTSSEGLQIAIIAPTWDVRGTKNITLDGSPGKAHKSDTAIAGLYSGSKGVDGKPGLPGSVGGNFFGIGAFVNGNGSINISANGGKGGPGQNGGNGIKGVDGTVPSTSDPKNYLISKGLYHEGYITHESYRCTFNVYDQNRCMYYYIFEWNIFGQNCTDGGKGGNGGRGGFGGNPGIINTIFLSGHLNISKTNATGNDGEHAKGGTGGNPGSTGEVMVVLQHGDTPNFETNNKKLLKCSPGIAGNITNENGIEKPNNTSLYATRILNEFKSYLRDSLNDTISNSFLMDFIDSLGNSSSVRDLYDISGLLNELYSLETEVHLANDRRVLVPFYRSLLKRVEQYIEKLKVLDSYSKNYKTLQYLRIATLSSLYRVYNVQDDLVVDIKTYFSLLEKHIGQYQKALKEVKISTSKNLYNKIIYSDIQEAESLIKQSIMPEINDIYDQIDTQISRLILDVKNQQATTKKEKNILIEKQNKLAKQLPLRGFLGAIKFTGQFLALAGPAGQLAGQLIGTGTDIVDNIVIDKKENLIGNIKKSFVDINMYFEKEQKNLKKNLEISMKEKDTIKTDPEINKIITPLQESLDQPDAIAYSEIKESTKIKLQQIVQLLADKRDALDKSNDITEENAAGVSTEVSEKTTQSNTDLSNPTETSEQKIIRRIMYVRRLQNAITIAEVGFDSIKKTKETKDLIVALGHNIRIHDEQISKLKNYEVSIYRNIAPMKSDLENTITEMGSKLSNKSHATLNVQKWKIDSIIQDFKTDIAFMIQASDPKIKSKVLACLDKLQNGISTLVRVYDIIQDYEDSVKLSNYIADLNSDVKISNDEQINSDIDKLEVIIKSNLVLQEYEKATTAFKQYLFPFASLYFEMFNLPSQSNNITDLVHSASLNINFMEDELAKQTTVVQKNAHQLFPDISFDNTEHEQEPFYVWDSKTNKKEITDLLKGKEVVLTADITTAVNKNAVKFKELSLQFIMPNENMQLEFDRLSQGFFVNMTHSGNSYYNCDNRHYIMTHSGITMKHSMCKDTSGHYYYLDMTSTILKQNPPIVSPYTTWHVQLLQKEGIRRNSFEMFNKYANWVEKLALEGRGQYVGLNLDVCSDHLDEYYERVDI